MKDAGDSQRYRSGARFFIYAPPIIGRRTKEGVLISKRKRPNPPYNGAEPWKGSVYYFWWEYLRRHAGYRKTCTNNGKGKYAKLYADFGDVHATDFWTWWRAHDHLFAEPAARQVTEWGADRQLAEDELIIAVPLEVRTAHLVRMFRKILKENADWVHRARGVSRAMYPVAAKPSLTALHTTLTIWDIRQDQPKLKLHELFDLAVEQTSITVDERVIITGDDDDEPYVIHLRKAEREAAKTGVTDVFLREARMIVRRRKAQTIKRHLRTAEAYIENVGLGKFPHK